jgi:hypothetical protein
MPPKYYDFNVHKRSAQGLRYYEQRFLLSPKQFSQFSSPATLAWTTVSFGPKCLSSVISEPGLYAFSIQTPKAGLPPHSYILYIGQTGAKQKTRTLRKRAGEYLKEEKSAKRRHVWEFLNKWSKHLSFHFAPVDPEIYDLEDIEKRLNDALLPPYSVNDFSAEIKVQKKAWQRT